MRKYTYHKKYTPEEREQVLALYRTGLSCMEVSDALGVSNGTVNKIVRSAGLSRGYGGARHIRETRIYHEGLYLRFESLRSAARHFGMRHECLRWALRNGTVKSWPADKFREHPGLDAMPTPYPFTTRSREVVERSNRRSRGEVSA